MEKIKSQSEAIHLHKMNNMLTKTQLVIYVVTAESRL